MTRIERFEIEGQLPTNGVFAHVTKAGPHVWMSGLIGRRADGSIPEDIVEQKSVIFENLDISLAKAGAKREHLVRTTLYMVDVSERYKLAEVRGEYYGEHIPTSTLAGVNELVFPEVKIELDVEAYIPA